MGQSNKGIFRYASVHFKMHLSSQDATRKCIPQKSVTRESNRQRIHKKKMHWGGGFQ